MLLSFSVENFRSFKAEQTLNMLASKRLGPNLGTPGCCELPGTEENILRLASLYGPNGAGKSNLVRALGLLKRLVLSGTAPGETLPYQPFLLDPASPTKPTSFEVRFLEEGEVFRYGVCFDAKRVHEEWLDVHEGTKERNLFTRADQEGGKVSVELGPAARGQDGPDKIEALAKVGARPNQLFLTEVVNLDDPAAQGPRFRRTINWFKSTLAVAQAGEPIESVGRTIAGDQEFAEFAGRFLREASTGIANLNVQTEEVSTLLSQFPSIFPVVVQAMVRPALGDAIPISTPEGLERLPAEPGEESFRIRMVLASHDQAHGQPVNFPLLEESDGSKRLLSLLPALYRLTGKGGVFVIDELERSMHPMLARKFIEFFLKAAPNAQSQLIFATHESTLLDLDLMRRDGIWFAEKDKEGATQLYSLADFKVRNDLRIEKGYLQGRFGAIPFLGGIDRLIEEQAAAEAGE
jgi:energy-coupling factor transporter ATP-binding protein EcfA2